MQSKLIGITLAALVLTASAYANVIFMPGNNPQPNEENVVFHTSTTNTMVSGVTDKTQTTVNYSSPQTLTPGNGSSDISGPSSGIRIMTITVPGDTFTDYIFNAFKANSSSNNLRVAATTSDGTVFTSTLFGGGTGNHFMTVIATGGEEIRNIAITGATGGGFTDLRNNQISGFAVAPVPEPSSMLLLGSGVLLLVQGLRRKLL